MPEATSPLSSVRIPVARNEVPAAGKAVPIPTGCFVPVRNHEFLKEGWLLVASSPSNLRNRADKPAAVATTLAPAGSFPAPAALPRNFND
jgi:hypothetical protein